MSAVCLPGSQQVWGLYLITTRLNSLRQWRLIWRGGPGLSLQDPVPNTITPLFRYPAVCYNFAIFQCQGPAFWRVFIEFPAGPCCRGHFLSSLHCCHQALFVKTPLDLLLFLSFFLRKSSPKHENPFIISWKWKKSGEVFFSAKHFWSFHSKTDVQHSPQNT